MPPVRDEGGEGAEDEGGDGGDGRVLGKRQFHLELVDIGLLDGLELIVMVVDKQKCVRTFRPAISSQRHSRRIPLAPFL